MNKLNIACCWAFIMTVIALTLLSFYPFIPAWAVFIAWAAFFHMDGGIHRQQAWRSTITHLGTGALAAWLSALALLANPFEQAVLSQLWGPLVIGAVIAGLSRMGSLPRFRITPAIIYGYASIFAFAGSPERFTAEALLSLSFNNALLTIMLCIVIGASAGYVNALLVELSTHASLRKVSSI